MGASMLTVSQAARAAKCSDQTISRLAKEGKLKTAPERGPRSAWMIAMSRDEVATAITKLAPKAGWKKTGKPAGKRKNGGTLSTLLEFAALGDKLEVLLALGKRFTLDELTTLNEL